MPALYLLTLLVVPGLLGLLVLMEWLERRFAQRFVADDIAKLLGAEVDTDVLEERIAVTARPLFTSSREPVRTR